MTSEQKNYLPKIAIIHDWLTVYAGAEKVLEQLITCFPNADIFTLVDFLPENKRAFLAGKVPQCSFVQNLPLARSKYRAYLPLMPLAVEQLNVSKYDLILSSSYAVAKGVIAGPDQLHVSYVHSPIRYAWDMQHQYLEESGLTRGLKSWIARWILHYIRLWDVRSATSVDTFVANSKYIARRIEKCYRRQSKVIYPPVDIEKFSFTPEKESYFMTASRMVPYKRIPLIVEAFSKMPDKKLIVVGDGPDLERVKATASSNVSVLGYQDDASLIKLMQNARAFVFAAEEDFGITPVEAQACGTPVIAYGKGGSLETVIGDKSSPNRTGVFFYRQTVDAIVDAVETFERDSESILPSSCRAHAERFSPAVFREAILAHVDLAWNEHKLRSGACQFGVH